MLLVLASGLASTSTTLEAGDAQDTRDNGRSSSVKRDGAGNGKTDSDHGAKSAASHDAPVASSARASRDATPPTTAEAKTSLTRSDLHLDLRTVTQATVDTAAPDAESRSTEASAERRKTLARSPRMRKNLLSVDTDDAPTELQDDAKAVDSKKNNVAVASPSKREKFGGLRALKARSGAKHIDDKGGGDGKSDAKDTAASKRGERRADDDKDAESDDARRDRKATKASKAKRAADDGNASSKTKSTTADRIDESDELDETTDKNKHTSEPKTAAPEPTSTLSPLRRRSQTRETQAPHTSSTTDAVASRLGLQHLALRTLPPAHQPEVHIVGEITSGAGFGSGGFACKWGVEVGGAWHHIAGDQVGQTQVDYPRSAHHASVWSHPIELHFATTSFHGWPKLVLQVWHFDAHMYAHVVGYGFVNVPFAPGEHALTASLWRPMGSAKDELAATLLGRTPELVTDDVVFTSANADRCRLQTVATGRVQLQVGVVLRNFETSNLAM